jgi:putative hydrolase of the HAD superfamily
MIRAVFLDAVDTLLFPEPSAVVKYVQVAHAAGSRLTPEAIAQRFRAAFRREERLDLDAGLRTDERRERRRWRDIVATVLDDVPDPPACFDELWDWFGRPGAWHVAEDAGPTLAELARRGLVLGVASNFDSRLRAVVAGHQPLSPVRHLVISSEVGWRKPARPFFDRIAETVGVPPSEVLFVGDHEENDVRGARAAGMRALLLAGSGGGQDSITRLGDLLRVDFH